MSLRVTTLAKHSEQDLKFLQPRSCLMKLFLQCSVHLRRTMKERILEEYHLCFSALNIRTEYTCNVTNKQKVNYLRIHFIMGINYAMGYTLQKLKILPTRYSLLHSRPLCHHTTLLLTNRSVALSSNYCYFDGDTQREPLRRREGALCDDTKNNCVADKKKFCF